MIYQFVIQHVKKLLLVMKNVDHQELVFKLKIQNYTEKHVNLDLKIMMNL